MPKKYYKTTIQVEVLSEGRLDPQSLEDVAYAIDQGDCSGVWNITSSKALSKKEVSEELIKQGSDPEFLLGGYDA